MGPQMFLKVARPQSVPAGGSFVTLPTRIFFARCLQVDTLEGPSWGVSVAMWQETGGPLGTLTSSVELTGRPAMASEGLLL